ncbi:Unconventional myosin-XVIIIa [Pseudolycoriella hygida]|uniref:Unconventional myosin-XVIIIa n=1 Tax=Pseudolycoriella hygida TaxID=35572 RepID=A0A9Q0MQR3_9DIPT|nr:Unconventional myosin-XVIIIa [Pseudolycoriella hygida]
MHHLSEMTVDLSEERSNANITNERLDVETNERIKLTRELEEQQEKNRELQNFTEKLELDLIAANSNPNDIFDDEDMGKEENFTAFKLKYDRAVKELEFTKRRMQTQHEYDLDQLVALKKQLEKKLADAYEEVEEQRQVVGQWKRKSQKFSVEMNDLRLLLEEQNSRNTSLEKRQRKFDAECQTLQDSARQEKQARERLGQEKDTLIAEKFTLEQSLAELDLTQEKLSNLQRDMEELSYSEQTEEEITQLKRSKIESERKCKEQEDELDEMAGQIQLLEQAKLRLEMTLETMRKEARHEAQQRDDELEEVRGSFFKKIKALECQLENEHEERTLLLREKHELERRLQTMEQQDHSDRMAEEAANLKLKRDLRKYKALFKDAQIQIDRMKGDVPSKNLIRQLRNQLEDAEAARTLAIKSKQLAESELADVQSMLEDVTRARHESDEKAAHAAREVGELRTQLEENEEELSELIKKYSTTVKQLNSEQLKHSEYETTISELEAEKASLKEHINELNERLENVEVLNDSSTNIQTKRLVLRTKELESKLELEHATRSRLEVQCNRHKENLEKTQTELMHIRSKESLLQEELKKTKKTLRETKEELHASTNRDQDHINKRQEASKKLETTESELASVRNDLRLALQRIADLQQAMEDGDYDDDSSESDLNDLSDGSISPVESTYLQNKRIGSIDLSPSTNSNETKATK